VTGLMLSRVSIESRFFLFGLGPAKLLLLSDVRVLQSMLLQLLLEFIGRFKDCSKKKEKYNIMEQIETLTNEIVIINNEIQNLEQKKLESLRLAQLRTTKEVQTIVQTLEEMSKLKIKLLNDLSIKKKKKTEI
jgi:hypothetical protein